VLDAVREETVLDLLDMAHQYDLLELEASIADYMKSILHVGNVCTVYQASSLYGLAGPYRYKPQWTRRPQEAKN
jgi:BTB/POZ domain-containing protein 9